jgi:hypothetical protein
MKTKSQKSGKCNKIYFIEAKIISMVLAGC